MKFRNLKIGSFALCLTLPYLAMAQQNNASLSDLLARPIGIQRIAPASHVPLEQRQGGLFVEARVNGVEREFVFDTGSPSMISRELAEQLGLEVIGSNTGRDANGAEVTMNFSVLDELEIGGVTFVEVPVLIFDFGALELGPCIFDGGVIGSEILPGSVWRIDTETQRLSIFAPGAAPALPASVVQAKMHLAGYPHPPVVEYSIGGLSDKLLFDTGTAETVTLFEKMADSSAVKGAVMSGSVSTGRGTHGVSAGGMGEFEPLQRFTLSRFKIGDNQLAPIRATTRVVPPSLLGAGLLSTHIVTLDYPGEQLTLQQRVDPKPEPSEIGYSLSITNGKVRVVQLFDESLAARAGLQLDDQVVAIGSDRIPQIGPNNICDTMHWLAQNVAPSAIRDLTVRRGEREITLLIELP